MKRRGSVPLASEVLNGAAARLAAVSGTPRLDAELLLAHALGISREDVLLGQFEIPPAFETLLARRLTHEPVAYITGMRDFWTISLRVTPAVLIPRPDSETLIEAAVAHCGTMEPSRVLDLGTGSGALLLAALDQWPGASGIGIDASAAALDIARENAEMIAPGRAKMRPGNWADRIDARFDLVLCNPPYVESGATLERQVAAFEPPAALFAGSDGLDAYRCIAPELPRLIAPGGMAAIEIGHSQRDAVTALLESAGLTVACRRDLAGHDRCLIARAK